VMISPDDSALEQRPKGIDALRVNFAAHVLAKTMSHGLMAISALQHAVAGMLMGRDQFDFIAHGASHKRVECLEISSLNHLADDVALARDCANNRSLTCRALRVRTDPLATVLVLFLTADECLIDFYDAHKLPELRVFHSGPKPHANVPSSLVRAGTNEPMNLKRADAFLARYHQMQNLEPSAQRYLGFFEDRSSLEREPIGRAIIFAALLALPMPRTRGAFVHVFVVTAGTFWASGPATQEQIRPARLLIREQPLEVAERHLRHESEFGLSVVRHASDIRSKQNGSQVSDNSHRNARCYDFLIFGPKRCLPFFGEDRDPSDGKVGSLRNLYNDVLSRIAS